MSQTSYSLDPSVAIAGMLADGTEPDVTSYPASEVIEAGRAVVLDAGGTVSLPKNTGALPANGNGSLKGVAIYVSARGPGAYQIGEMVPILRKGRIWAQFAGTGPTDQEAMQVRHASDDSNSELQHRGKFTDAAASTTVGQEKTAFTKGISLGGDTSLVKLDVNFP